MSYTPPAGDEADFSYVGSTAYTALAGDAADFSFIPPETFVEATVSGSFPPLTASLFAADISERQAEIAGTFPPLTAALVVADLATVPGDIAGTFPPLTVSVLAAPGRAKVVPLGFVFNDPPAEDGHLVFMPSGDVAPESATISGAFAPLSASVSVVQWVESTVSGTFAGLSVVVSAQYRTNTSRPTVGKSEVLHQVATKFQDGPTQPQQDAAKDPVAWQTFFQRVTGFPAGVTHHLPDVFQKTPVANTGAFQDGTKLHDKPSFKQQDATRAHQQRTGVFQDGTDVRDDTLFKHQDGDRTKRPSLESLFQNASKLHVLAHRGRFQSAQELLKGIMGRFQDGVPPPPGISLIPQPPGPQPCYLPDSDLVFQINPLGELNFVFICDGYTPPPPPPPPGETIVVPVRSVYIVINNLALRRTSDNAVVPAFQFSLSLDVSSWSWGFSASLPATAQALVEPTTGPVELSAFVNGQEFRVLAEQVGRERAFGQATIRISGRGRNAVLDAPYSPTQVFSNGSARTHQQLFDDVLTFNGVPLGYAVDYGLDTWTVPTGVFNHQGTYISALNALAQAGGAYLIPHPSALSFKVRHLYPAAPWEWDEVTPDFVLPSAVVSREGLTWKEQPAYNRVYVSGQEQGVLGRVTREGTAGDILAPMVTDPLITAAAAARQRGLAVLGNTGKQIEHQLRLPVLQATGIIQPGAFVEYEDGGSSRIGIVRSTQVDAQMPDVWQTLGVEVHDYA